MKKNPDELRLIMIDPKRVELTPYTGIPHLLTPPIVEPSEAIIALKLMVEEMQFRFKQLEEDNSKNIATYNEKSKKNDRIKMPYIVVIVDELADLMLTASSEVEKLLVVGAENISQITDYTDRGTCILFGDAVDNIDPQFRIHKSEIGCWPHGRDIRISTSTHIEVGLSIALAQNNGEFWDRRKRQCIHPVHNFTGCRLAFSVDANQEPWHVNEHDYWNVEGITKDDKARCLAASVRIRRSAFV